MRAAWLWLSSGVAALTLSTAEVRAAEPWLTASGSRRCPADERELAASIEQQAAGTRNPELRVEIEIRDQGRDTGVVVRIGGSAGTTTAKTFVAPVCEEALEAVVSIVALALSVEQESRPEAANPRAGVKSALRSWRASISTSDTSFVREPDLDRGVSPSRLPAVPRVWQLHWAVGLDVGTLPDPTPILGVGIATSLRSSEVRAALWYGLPSSREEISSNVETTSAQFAALAADYCRGIDSERWFSVCAGVEARVTRLRHGEAGPNQALHERARLFPGLGPIAGATLVHRSVGFQPRLAFFAEIPLLGAPGLEEGPILRAMFGGALPL